MESVILHFRFWLLADIQRASFNVCFRGQSGHSPLTQIDEHACEIAKSCSLHQIGDRVTSRSH